ncbi:NAD(P)-dependent oxidoreductase [Niastella yeongjuensis]|uniref:dTDP-4-dehydrorhamnose reductase n=1 Tax=Niastella yeongjuensis TaxID=354355 RepID=A0A1V9F8D3_9BACT|nr:SDR family oxidoreductase [Niastella yeongjuensis]OQP54669.1 NAD(P)-dependent oxidoreductase [Niastella yeongjuensis]SEO03216.1 dTDP-4-dehydrorhamnose reductase [Niastella yeongjuensis]
MKVLITGANGLLGQHLTKLLLDKNYQVVATSRGESRLPFEPSGNYTYHSMDIANAFDTYAIMNREQPDVVVHAAAMTQVDDCELQPEVCERINVQGTAQILTDAETFSSHFIYVSTDFVFDGEKGNYSEEEDTNPISLYGFTKLQAESMVQVSDVPFAIVRTCLVYGNLLKGTRSNIVSWVRESLEKDKTIQVVSDQLRTPTYVGDLAKGIALIIEKKATGIYHISGKDWLTPYDIALKTAQKFQLDASKIVKVDASTFKQPGRRPLKTGFVIEKARKELGYEPMSFDEGLDFMG